MSMRRSWSLVAALAAVLAMAGERDAPAQQAPAKQGGARTQAPKVEPKADALLHKMSDHLAGLTSFAVTTDHATDVVLQDGQKIELTGGSRILVERPNLLRSDRRGQPTDVSFFYDGRTVSVFDHEKKLYATAQAPATIDATIDYARDVLGLEAPGADLLYSDPYRILMEDVVSGRYVGKEWVNGVNCHHLAYRGNETDWQIWIQDGPRPLPCKYLIVSKNMAQAPEFSVELHGWDVDKKIPSDTFAFVPPEGAEQIEFIRRAPAAQAPADKGGGR